MHSSHGGSSRQSKAGKVWGSPRLRQGESAFTAPAEALPTISSPAPTALGWEGGADCQEDGRGNGKEPLATNVLKWHLNFALGGCSDWIPAYSKWGGAAVGHHSLCGIRTAWGGLVPQLGVG